MQFQGTIIAMLKHFRQQNWLGYYLVWARKEIKCRFPVLFDLQTCPKTTSISPLPTVLLSVVSVTRSQPQSQILNRKFQKRTIRKF